MARPMVAWEYYFARKFSTQRFATVCRVFFTPYFWRHFNIKLRNILVIPAGRNHAIYLDRREWPPAQERIYRRVCRNLATFQRYARVITREQQRYLRTAAAVARGNLVQLAPVALAQRFRRWARAHLEFFIKPIWIPFPIEPPLAEETRVRLEAWLARRGQAKEIDQLLQTVFSPEEKNAITREREAWLKLLARARRRADLAALVARHHRRFQWIPCYDLADRPWELAVFTRRLRDRMTPAAAAAELDALRREFRQRGRRFHRLLVELQPPRRLRELMVMAHRLVHIKDERDDVRRLGTFLAQPLYAEIARRAGLTLRQIANLTAEETVTFLESGTLPPRSDIAARLNGYLLLRRNGGELKLYAGSALERMRTRELPATRAAKGSSCQGMAASPGRAIGVVSLVSTKHDLRRVKPKDVLVAVTTHPDFVPAMRIASAIVTDEGGLTSHAAIVSRELGIPCVVGCKVATKLLKDGDRVAVDATRGVVQKLRR